jgi:hypothetical protein
MGCPMLPVAAFRRGLDVDELTKSVSLGKAQLFDLAAAHELYVALLGPVEALVQCLLNVRFAPETPHHSISDKFSSSARDFSTLPWL